MYLERAGQPVASACTVGVRAGKMTVRAAPILGACGRMQGIRPSAGPWNWGYNAYIIDVM